MLRIAVCDDDETSLQAIKKLVAQTLKEEYVLTSFHSGLDLMLYLSEQVKGQLDIAILDIDLGEGQNGIELAISAHSTHASRSFKEKATALRKTKSSDTIKIRYI